MGSGSVVAVLPGVKGGVAEAGILPDIRFHQLAAGRPARQAGMTVYRAVTITKAVDWAGVTDEAVDWDGMTRGGWLGDEGGEGEVVASHIHLVHWQANISFLGLKINCIDNFK